jgi:hypothetical protein
MRLTGELADLAHRSGRDTYLVLDNARRALHDAGRARGDSGDELCTTVDGGAAWCDPDSPPAAR